MSRIRFLAASLALLSGSALAQTLFYLPKGYETPQGRNYDQTIFGVVATSFPAHVQHLYATAELPAPVVQVKQIAYRRNNYYGNSVFASTQTLTLAMSHGAGDPTAASTTFATNEGGDRTVVFSGTLNWPAAPYSGPNPAPFVFVIKLTSPFLCLQARGKSLVFDYRLTARDHQSTSGQTSMFFDAAGVDSGVRNNNGNSPSTCKFSNGKYNSGLSYTTAGLSNAGGTWYVSYSNLLANSAGIMTLSAFGVPNKGPWPLPIDLTGFGMPGCFWHVGLETGIWGAFTTDANGNGRIPNVTIPPGLGGAKFYDHGLVVDAQANSRGLVTTWASEWQIGTGVKPVSATVYKTQDSASSPTGTLRADYALIMEAQY